MDETRRLVRVCPHVYGFTWSCLVRLRFGLSSLDDPAKGEWSKLVPVTARIALRKRALLQQVARLVEAWFITLHREDSRNAPWIHSAFSIYFLEYPGRCGASITTCAHRSTSARDHDDAKSIAIELTV